MQPLHAGDPRRIGAYLLLARLGSGGMGVVYLGRSGGGRLVAVKVVRERFARDAQYRVRFRREVSAARAVSGTFTAPVLDADADAAAPWLATTYLPGLSLREAVDNLGPLPGTVVRLLAAGLAEALAAIHRAGLVHRDLKPANVMLTADGPRVIDFGIVRPEAGTAITGVDPSPGTPGFMSPEQVSGGRIGPPSDIFTLGTVLAYAATGLEPFGSGPAYSRQYRVMRVQPDLDGVTDSWLHKLIEDCFQCAPEARPSAAEIVERLAVTAEGELSLNGTGWLPEAVAAAIERRTVEAQKLAELTVDVPETSPATPPEPFVAGETLVGTDRTREGNRLLSRRVVVASVGGAAVLAVGTAGALLRDRRLEQPTAARTPAPAKPPATTPSRPVSPSPSPRATLRWSRRASVGELRITGGVLLVFGGDLHAMRPETGRPLWKRAISPEYTAAGEKVYLVPREESWQASAVRASSGRTLWVNDTDHAPSEWMATVDPVVCVGGDSEVEALNTADGRSRWRSTVSAKYGLAAGEDLVLAVSPRALVALAAETGRTRWTYAMDIGEYPAVGAGLAFAYDRFGALHAVRADTGERAWRRPGLKAHTSQVGGGLVYAEGVDGEVLALDVETGESVWSRRLGEFEGDRRIRANAFGWFGGTLYVASTSGGALFALNASDGRVLWTYDEEAPDLVAPVSSAGLVFIGTADGRVRALAPPEGTHTGGGTHAGPRAR